jgi:predicted nucleotidyltransferase
MESTTPTGSDSNEVLVARASEFLSAVGWLADAGLLGAFVIGSVGAGMADELSDVDLAVVFDRAGILLSARASFGLER